LQEVDIWLNRYREFWNKKLDALGTYLERQDDTDLPQDKNHLKNK
jgi:hypothetical protein